MPAFNDLSGLKFGRLLVLDRGENIGKRVGWRCLCDCGKKVLVAANKLPNGHTRSCGCLQVEMAHVSNFKHGHTTYPNGGRCTKEYNTWTLMKRRCSDVAVGSDRAIYFDQGIRVCERWQSFEAFFADMGFAPSARHSIDRIDPNKGYSPDNCRWATPREQARNKIGTRTITHQGVARPLAEWSEITGIPYKRLHKRLSSGWSAERALTTP